MDQILNQLGGLILGSIPTIIFFITLVVAYGFLVRRPLDRVLAERRARTTGAVEQARGAILAAEAETAVFEDKLRAAKREIYEARDKKLKQWAAEREQALAGAKAQTAEKVNVAKQALDQSAIAAKQQIEGMSGELSAQILKAVLPAGVSGTEAAQ
jgi:F-type H+-transporting ATPase subunit b